MAAEILENFYALIVVYDPSADAGAAIAHIGECAPRNRVRLIAAANSSEAGSVIAKMGSLGCTHVIAFDAAEDCSGDCVAPLIAASDKSPAALILAQRLPRRHARFFDRAANLAVRLETGQRIHGHDGPRAYPISVIQSIDPAGDRHLSELEMLVRSIWTGCEIEMTPIAMPQHEFRADQSHSISSRQMVQELTMHARLLTCALGGVSHLRRTPAYKPSQRPSFWRMVWRWLNPMEAWRELRQGGAGRNEMAVGLAIGAFIGNMPAWGFHTAISLYVARRLHLNPLAVMTGSHASAPPMGPVLVGSAMWVGHVILHGSRPRWEEITPFHGKFWSNAGPLLLDWTLGALIVGTTLAIIVYIAANFLFRFVEKKKVSSSPLAVEAGASGVS